MTQPFGQNAFDSFGNNGAHTNSFLSNNFAFGTDSLTSNGVIGFNNGSKQINCILIVVYLWYQT